MTCVVLKNRVFSVFLWTIFVSSSSLCLFLLHMQELLEMANTGNGDTIEILVVDAFGALPSSCSALICLHVEFFFF